MDFNEAFALPKENWLEVLQDYIRDGGDVNEHHPNSDWTLLHLAAEHGNIEAIRLLVNNGADINVRDVKGLTPLHWAVDSDIDGAIQTMTEITFASTRTLLELGADQTLVGNNGERPRDYARALGRDILELYDSLIRHSS
jgi:ankyrin repeat protein